MQRGIPDITVYTFEVPQGQEMTYPDAELWTLSYAEADAFAADRGYLLMGQDWGDDEPELIEDYAPHWSVTDKTKDEPVRWFMTQNDAMDFVEGTTGNIERYAIDGPDGES